MQHIKDTISNFLDKLCINFEDVEIKEEFGQPRFIIKTQESNILIGKKGENFKALSFLLKKIVNKGKGREEETQFSIDVNDYQDRQIEQIKNKARFAAERAKTFKTDIELEPMGAFERMVAHSTLSEDRNIKTESEGEGKFRHVVVRYIEETKNESF